MTIKSGEFGLIERIRQRIGTGGKGVALGIGDDAAVLLPPPGKLLAACDMLIEGVHFLREYVRPRQLGWKALAVNISDIAAMGGIPLFALVSMGIADWVDDTHVEGIYEGMLDIAKRFNVELVGGDTVRSPNTMVLNVGILGSANSPVTRAGACPGHLMAVTGYLGSSAAGLACLRQTNRGQGIIRVRSKDVMSSAQPESGAEAQPGTQLGLQVGAHPEVHPGVQLKAQPEIRDKLAGLSDTAWIDELVKAHLEPMPRVREGRALASTGVVSAMMDISDGLAGEAYHIARESKVGVTLSEDAIPIGEATLRAARLLERDPLEWALSGGEDFELVFTFPPESADTVQDALLDAGRSMHIVGHITPEAEGVVLVSSDGSTRNLLSKGYNHFDKM